jgi:hypothetical protein
MFIKKYFIRNVNKGYSICEDTLIYQSESALFSLRLSDLVVSKQVSIRDRFFFLSSFGEEIFAKSNTEYTIFNRDLQVTLQSNIGLASGYPKLFGNRCFTGQFVHLIKAGDRRVCLYDILSRQVCWYAEDGENIKFDSNQIFSISNTSISKRDIETGAILWRKSIENGDTVPQFEGVTDRIALLWLQTADKLIAFDLETGATKWERRSIASGFAIDSNRGLLLQMHPVYSAFDLETGQQVETHIGYDYFESIGIQSHRDNLAFDGTHIYTTDRRKAMIGAFNVLTQQFDWVHREEGISFPAANPIVYKAPYLLVHDNKGDLHVFEKAPV